MAVPETSTEAGGSAAPPLVLHNGSRVHIELVDRTLGTVRIPALSHAELPAAWAPVAQPFIDQGVLGPHRSALLHRRSQRGDGWMSGVAIARMTSLLVVALISIAVPLAMAWVMDPQTATTVGQLLGGAEQLTWSQVHTSLALRTVMVMTGACLPGVLQFVFETRARDEARQAFLDVAIWADPDAWTLEEALERHGHQLREERDSGGRARAFRVIGRAAASAAATLGAAVGLSAALLQTPPPAETFLQSLAPESGPIIFGFLGAYVFALAMLFRGFIRGDLQARTYVNVIVRTTLTVIVVYVLDESIAALPEVARPPQGLVLFAAFLGAIAPWAAIGLVGNSLLRDSKVLAGLRRDVEGQRPLGDLGGITLFERARLAEEGIETVEGLAMTDPLRLVAHTMLPAAQVFDLLDQAILILHLPRRPVELAPGEATPVDLRARLLELGVRTASDLMRLYEGLEADDPDRAALDGALGHTGAVARQSQADKNAAYVPTA